MEKPKKNFQDLWMAISFILAIGFGIYANNEPKRVLKAIRKHQLDTIEANDSIYVIKANINKVYYERSSVNDAPPDNR